MVSRMAVASRSRFDLLQQDELDSSDSEHEIEPETPQAPLNPNQHTS